MRKSSIFALALTTGLLASGPSAFANPAAIPVEPDVTPAQIDGGQSSTVGEGDKVEVISRGGARTTRLLTSAEKQRLYSRGTRLTSTQVQQAKSGLIPSGVSVKVARFFKHIHSNPLNGTPDGNTGGANPDCVFWYSVIDSVDADGNPLDADGNVISIPLDEQGRRIITGTDGNDVLCGDDDPTNSNRSEVFFGGDGNDRIEAGDGDDVVYGEGGDDVIYGQSGADFLRGDDGNDLLFGGREADNVGGKAGDDMLWGGQGKDLLYGHGGRDFLNGGNAAESGKNDWAGDKLDCGDDKDSFVSELIDQTNGNCEENLGHRNLGPGTEPNGGLLHLFQKALAGVVAGGFVIFCVAPSVVLTGVVLAHFGPHAALPVGVITIPASVVGCGLVGKLIFAKLSN